MRVQHQPRLAQADLARRDTRSELYVSEVLPIVLAQFQPPLPVVHKMHVVVIVIFMREDRSSERGEQQQGV